MLSFRRIPLTACLALAILVPACSDDRQISSPPDPPALSPTTQWAGGVVRVTLEGVTPEDLPPQLTLDGDPLAVADVGDGWVEYRLPRTIRGEVTLELTGDVAATFDVNVLGFRGVQPLAVALRGNLLVWPRSGPASVLGLASDDSGVIQVLPGSSHAEYLVEAPVSSAARGVGPTHDPDLLLVPRDVVELSQLLPTTQIIDTLAVPFSRHAMLLSDSVYVYSGHHEIASVDPRVGSPFLHWDQYEESQGTVVSPTGRYGAFRVNGSQPGPPVFSAETGVPVFHVDTLFRSYGVDFSPVGDTLYITGIRRAPPVEHLVLAYETATGELVGGLELGADLDPYNMVRDPNGPWLFVMAVEGSLPDAPVVMLVVDTRTMELAGAMATQVYRGCVVHGGDGCEGAVAVGPEGVFYVSTGSTAPAARDNPAVVLAFDGWPAE